VIILQLYVAIRWYVLHYMNTLIFGIYGTSSLQQQATGRHYPDSESISLLLLLNDAFWRESSKSKFHTFGLTWWGLEPRIYPAPETITLTITTPMCLLLTSECYVSNYYRWGGHIIFYISISRMFGCGLLSRVKLTNRVLLSFKTKRQLFPMLHCIIGKAKRFTRKK
jgi:hypothetical protein